MISEVLTIIALIAGGGFFITAYFVNKTLDELDEKPIQGCVPQR